MNLVLVRDLPCRVRPDGKQIPVALCKEQRPLKHITGHATFFRKEHYQHFATGLFWRLLDSSTFLPVGNAGGANWTPHRTTRTRVPGVPVENHVGSRWIAETDERLRTRIFNGLRNRCPQGIPQTWRMRPPTARRTAALAPETRWACGRAEEHARPAGGWGH